MKTKILLSITMLIIVFIHHLSANDFYQGLVQKKDSTYLMIDGKIIPIDSGITYEQAKTAYFNKGNLCLVGQKSNKITERSFMVYDRYVIYDGSKIYQRLGEGKQKDNSLWDAICFGIFAIIAFMIIWAIHRMRGAKI